MDTKQRCTAKTKAGKRCKNKALPNSDPPRCGIPAHAARGPGAPAGNKNAEKHGYYSKPDPADDLDSRITDLKKKRERLSHYIDEHAFDVEPMEYAKLADLLGRLDSRIDRLVKSLQAMAGHGGDEFLQIMDSALDELSTEWGVEL